MTLVGCYVGNPNGSNAEEMAAFERNFDAHVQAIGVAPTCMSAFGSDNGQGWGAMVEQAEWTAWSWTLSSRSAHLIPVVGIPMTCAGDVSPEVYKDIAAGVHDAVWHGIAQAWQRNGFPHAYFRLGWEFNGSWYGWSVLNLDEEGRAAWIAAWRHIARQLKSVSPEFKTVWNTTITGWMPWDVTLVYPGDDVVDVVGLDAYSPVWQGQLYDWALNDGHTVHPDIASYCQSVVNRTHYWDYPGANQWEPHHNNCAVGMMAMLELAAQHGKPMSFPECGAGLDPNHTAQGLHDDAEFVSYLLHRIKGPVPCELICVWDANLHDGAWQFSGEPSPQPDCAVFWKRLVAAL